MTTVDSPAAPLAPEALASELGAALEREQPEALRRLRRDAFARFTERGLPGRGDEEWRFTNLGDVLRSEYVRPPRRATLADLAEEVAPSRLRGTHELVFVDGRFAAELSSPGDLPEGVTFRRLGGPEGGAEAAGGSLGRHAQIAERPFAALSTALFEEAAWLDVARGRSAGTPIHVLSYSTASDRPTFRFPRLLVTAGERSELVIVESYAGSSAAPYLVAPVAEIVAGPASRVDHAKLQRDGEAGSHLSLLHIQAERDANVTSRTYSLGAALARHDVQAVLGGEGAEVTLDGLYLVRDRQIADYHMRVDHAKPHTTSHELFKGILDGRARGVFNGRIHVHPQAQKTDAKQSSRNLLLSEHALVNANPQLEIFADDVKCTHGSTVGQLDEEAVFYLRSRGIGLEAARSLLTYAFAADLVERAKVDALRETLQEFLFAWIPQGEIVREAV